MKKPLERLVSTYFLKSGIWSMALLLEMSVLPLLLKSIAMLVRQNALPSWVVIAVDILTGVGAGLLFYSVFRNMDGYPGTSFLRGMWRSFSKGGLWLAATALFSDTAYKIYIGYGGLIAFKGYSVLYLPGQILVSLIICSLLSVVAFWMICIIANPKYDIKFIKSFKFWLRKPLLCLSSILSVCLLLFVIPLLYDYILKKLPGLSLSFLEITAGGVLLSLMQWAVLQPLLAISFNNALQFGTVNANNITAPGEGKNPVAGEVQLIPAAGVDTSDVNSQPARTNTSKGIYPVLKRQFSILCAIAIIVASGIYGLATGYPITAVSAVKQDIKLYFNNGSLMEKSGDFAAAAYYNRIAEARILAWQGAVLDKPDTMNQAVSLAPSDEQVQLLSALKNGNSMGALEQGFLAGGHNKAWYLALLNSYADSTGLNDIQKQRKAELMNICILQGYFCTTSVMPEDLAANKDSFAKMLNSFEGDISAGKYDALMARVGEDGGINRQLVLDTLDMAEKYSDNMDLQYLAMSYGTSFLEDNAQHYGRTADAALRYDSLYMNGKSQKASKAQIINEKLIVAKALMTCGEVKKSVEFLSNLQYKSADLTLLEAGGQFSLKAYDKCQQSVSDFLKDKPDNPQALYLAAMSSLQLKDIDNSIGYAIRLAKVIETADKKKNTGLEAESLLYPYLLRFTINDGTGHYNSEAFSTLNEEQMKLLKSDEFLNNYLNSAYLWTKNNDESRSAALALLDKVLAVNGNLSRALYMKGAIYFELNRDEEALRSLKASLDLDENQPTAWYALANLYDRLQKYNEAYAACQKVLEYLPSTDHSTDVFGVAVHTSQLMGKLKPLTREGD